MTKKNPSRPETRSIVTRTLVRGGAGPQQKRAEEKLDAILRAAAALIARHGYDKTSIRDVARETGCSLAGMYYYFKSKEDLLYRIQYHTFSALLSEQEQTAAKGGEPEEQLRRLVHNHLYYFVEHTNELKVCGFELESLAPEHYREVEGIRRRYFKLMAAAVGRVMGRTGGAAAERAMVRRATMFLFGMLNWIYTWYEPQRDGPVRRLEDEMVRFILSGLRDGLGKERDGRSA